MKTLLTTTVATGLLVAATGVNAQEVTLHFWDYQQSDQDLIDSRQAMMDQFMEENPAINVKLTAVPYPEYQQRLQIAVRSGNAPDVATLDQIWMGPFAQSGSLAPLDELASEAGVDSDTYFDGAWESAIYNDSLYGVPFNVDVWQFSYYNQDLLDEAGVDPESLSTFEGLRSAAEALTGEGQFGVGLFGHRGDDTVVMVNSFIFSNGGHVLAEDGNCALDEPEAVKALEYLQDLAQYAPNGVLNASSQDMRELFRNGSLAIEFWPALEQPLLETSDINWGFTVGTAPEGMTPIGAFGGWNLAVFESSEHEEAAWKFIQFMTREDINGKVVDLIPANVEAADAFLEENREGADRILTHLENARARPLSPNYLDISEIQLDLYQDVYSGGDVAQAATQACEKIDAL